MERVQYQQEEMLAELRDLTEKGLFTTPEVKQIIKKRTAFENSLTRKAAKKTDYLRYISYEMNLEQLRKKRAERLKVKSTPATISDFAMVRRQFYIYERALKKFKSDVGLWIQYINAAQKERAWSLVGRITARALQLHANVPALYILAASHEMRNLSPSSARTLLQRGIRLNAESVELWREYVKLELTFVETLRRRWNVLGLDQEPTQVEPSTEDRVEDFPGINIDQGLEARKAVLKGAIVKSAISNAYEALPNVDLFEILIKLLREFPSALYLRQGVLEHLYETFRPIKDKNDRALKLYATRHFETDMDDEDLVEAIRKCNEELTAGVRDEATARVYGEFVAEHVGDLDGSMRDYLVSSLGSVLKRVASPSLMVIQVELEMQRDPVRAVKLGRKYSEKKASSVAVWLSRLKAEYAIDREQSFQTWKLVKEMDPEVKGWGLERFGDDTG